MLVPEGSPHGSGRPGASVLVRHEAEGPRPPLGRGAVAVLLKLRRVGVFFKKRRSLSQLSPRVTCGNAWPAAIAT